MEGEAAAGEEELVVNILSRLCAQAQKPRSRRVSAEALTSLPKDMIEREHILPFA